MVFRKKEKKTKPILTEGMKARSDANIFYQLAQASECFNIETLSFCNSHANPNTDWFRTQCDKLCIDGDYIQRLTNTFGASVTPIILLVALTCHSEKIERIVMDQTPLPRAVIQQVRDLCKKDGKNLEHVDFVRESLDVSHLLKQFDAACAAQQTHDPAVLAMDADDQFPKTPEEADEWVEQACPAIAGISEELSNWINGRNDIIGAEGVHFTTLAIQWGDLLSEETGARLTPGDLPNEENWFGVMVDTHDIYASHLKVIKQELAGNDETSFCALLFKMAQDDEFAKVIKQQAQAIIKDPTSLMAQGYDLKWFWTDFRMDFPEFPIVLDPYIHAERRGFHLPEADQKTLMTLHYASYFYDPYDNSFVMLDDNSNIYWLADFMKHYDLDEAYLNYLANVYCDEDCDFAIKMLFCMAREDDFAQTVFQEAYGQLPPEMSEYVLNYVTDRFAYDQDVVQRTDKMVKAFQNKDITAQRSLMTYITAHHQQWRQAQSNNSAFNIGLTYH